MSRRLSLLLVTCVAVGCVDGGATDPTASTDASAARDAPAADSSVADSSLAVDGTPPDAEPNAVPDANVPPPDAELDASPDANVPPPDAEPDAMPDANVPPPDAEPDAEPDANVPSPDADTPDADTPDADTPDAEIPDASSPVLDTATTSDGFRQIRQGDSATLVITGRDLASATGASLGTLALRDLVATDTEIRGSLEVPHAHVSGPLDLTVTLASGTATLPAAFAVTHYVISPAAAGGGHGTYESPLRLCEPAVETAARGDTLELAAGEHACSAADPVILPAGVHVTGAGTDRTVLAAQLTIESGSPGDTSTFGAFTTRRDITIGDVDSSVIVTDIVADGGGLVWFREYEPRSNRTLIASRIRYQGDSDPFTIQTVRTVTILDSEIRTTGPTCLTYEEGTLLVRNTTFVGCQTGVVAGWHWTQDTSNLDPAVRIVDSRFIDTGRGVHIHSGNTTLDHTEIVDDPTTDRTCATGVWIAGGSLHAINGSRIDCAENGIMTAVVGAPEFDPYYNIRVTDSVIRGGRYGISAGMSKDYDRVTITRARVFGGQAGLLLTDDEAQCFVIDSDLSSNGFAFDDQRIEIGWWPEVGAGGTTLNGQAFHGRIQGPATLAPHYRLRSSDGALYFSGP